MKKLIITNKLNKNLINNVNSLEFISFKKLTKKEIDLAKLASVSRYEIPKLNRKEKLEFYNEFDKCWDMITKNHETKHPFWRDAISSKMQEWDKSSGYFLLVLYTIIKKEIKNEGTLIIICSSIEEQEFCKDILGSNQFIVQVKTYSNFSKLISLILQRIIDLIYFSHFFLLMVRKKAQCSTLNPANNFDKGSKKTIICSLFYWESIKNNNYVDSFFGTVHEYLKKNNCDVLYLAAPIDMNKGTINNIKDVQLVTPYNLISWLEIIVMSLRLFFRTINFDKILFMKTDVSKVLLRNSKKWSTYFNFHSEVFYYAAKKISRLYDIDRVLLLFEGNSFERACIQAFKEKSQDIKILGYSHAVIFPLNLKLHLTPNEKINRPEPDLFLVPGPELKNLLNDVGKRDLSTIIESCSLRDIARI